MSADQEQAAARQGTGTFQESLGPSPAAWVVILCFGAGLGLIPGPIDVTVALVTSAVGLLLVITGTLAGTPRLRLAQGVFSAGRARVPARLVAKVEPLDAAQWKAALGVDLDARAYLCTRGWVKTGIRVTLDDPQDPTPYWLVSTRRPKEWVRALGS